MKRLTQTEGEQSEMKKRTEAEENYIRIIEISQEIEKSRDGIDTTREQRAQRTTGKCQE